MLSVNPLYLMKHRVRQTGCNWSKTALVVATLIIWPVLAGSLALGQTVPNRGLRDLQEAFRAVARTVKPAVVNVSAVKIRQPGRLRLIWILSSRIIRFGNSLAMSFSANSSGPREERSGTASKGSGLAS